MVSLQTTVIQRRTTILPKFRPGCTGESLWRIRLTSCSSNRHLYLRTSAVQHFEQCINAEPVDSPPYQVADARLANTKDLCGARLGELTRSDHPMNFPHQ